MPDTNIFDTDYTIGEESLYDENILVADATNISLYGSQLSPNLSMDFPVSKGRYKLTVKNPSSPSAMFGNESIYVPVDDGVNIEYKKVIIESVKYDFSEERAYVYIDVKENPIPIVLLWGAVILACSIAGALAINSVLESVETLSDSVFGDIGTLIKNPISWAIIAIVGAGVILPYVYKRK